MSCGPPFPDSSVLPSLVLPRSRNCGCRPDSCRSIPVHEQEQVSTTDPDSTYATKGGTPARLSCFREDTHDLIPSLACRVGQTERESLRRLHRDRRGNRTPVPKAYTTWLG